MSSARHVVTRTAATESTSPASGLGKINALLGYLKSFADLYIQTKKKFFVACPRSSLKKLFVVTSPLPPVLSAGLFNDRK